MRKGIMAMEEMGTEIISESEIDQEAAGVSQDVSEIENSSAQIDEAREIKETVDTMAEKVEASPEGITEETADVLNTAVEHFCNRLGYKKKVVPAMEGFSVSSRKQATAVALENMHQLSARVGAQIKIAQEGLFARIRNAVERTFTSDKKIAESLTKMANATAKEITEIKDPAWGRVFARGGKTEIASADVVAYLSSLDKAISGKSIALIEKATALVSKGTALLKKSDFQVADGVLAEFEKLASEASKLSEAFSKAVGEQGKELNVNMTSAEAKDFNKISELALRLISDKSFSSEYDKLFQAYALALEEIGRSDKVRIVSRATANDLDGGAQASDVRAFCEIFEKSLDSVFEILSDVVITSYKAGYSSYKYLAASSSK